MGIDGCTLILLHKHHNTEHLPAMGSVPISKAKPTTLPALRPGRVLSNLAAEFVEVRAGREICDRTTEVHDDHRESETANDGNATAVPLPKFIKTVDRFMTLEEAPEYDNSHTPADA